MAVAANRLRMRGDEVRLVVGSATRIDTAARTVEPALTAFESRGPKWTIRPNLSSCNGYAPHSG